jgi:hypothetical protein
VIGASSYGSVMSLADLYFLDSIRVYLSNQVDRSLDSFAIKIEALSQRSCPYPPETT